MQDLDACLRFLRERAGTPSHRATHWSELGLVLYYSGRFEEALEAADHALEIDPLYREAVITRSFSLYQLGRVADGFVSFKSLHARNPDDFQTALALGVYCMLSGWKHPGLAQILRAEAMRPGVPFVLSYAAAAFEALGEKHAAKDRDHRARQGLTRLLAFSLTGSLDLSKKEFYRQWKNPSLPRVPIVLATYLREHGRVEDGEALLLRANSRFPGHPELLVETGRFLHARHKLSEATSWFTAAVCMDETYHPAYFELGFLHAHAENPKLAVRAVERAVALRPLFSDYRYHLGNLLLELGHQDDAIEQFEKVRMLDPSDGYSALQLASILVRQEEWKRASEVLESASCQDWPEAQILFAQTYRRLGEEEKARACLEKALEVDATHDEAKELLAEIAQ